MKNYDVIVIGAGSAGLGSSGVANEIGLKTLLIEKDADNFGGDCTNFGCVPSKALIHIAHQFHAAKRAEPFGLISSGKADMQKVLDYIHSKQEFIKKSEDAAALRKQGIDVVIGTAKFADKNTIEVAGEKYTARLILLCTGSSPRMIDIDGMDQMTVYTNESLFFNCTELPDHFIVVGGGPIGCEMAQAFARLGSKVTIVNRGNRLLDREPEKVSKILTERFEAEDITVLTNAEIKSFSNQKAIVEFKNGKTDAIPCSAVLLAIGRVVNTEGMELEKGGITLTDKGKIKVNTYLQSTNKKVYVIGDAAGTYMFSHGAEKMVRQLWRNLLIPVFKKKNTENDLSWVTFTDPQVAHFGLTESQLNDQGISYYRQDQNFEHDDRAIVQEYQYGTMSLWFGNSWNDGNRKILSGSMIAPQAGELIQELQLAKEAGVSIKTINDRVYPYPVMSRINQKTVRGLMHGKIADWKKVLARWVFRLFN